MQGLYLSVCAGEELARAVADVATHVYHSARYTGTPLLCPYTQPTPSWQSLASASSCYKSADCVLVAM